MKVCFEQIKSKDEANKAFATSVQIDLNLPKAWAEWGMFNDRRFKENPNDMVYANNAISCYLQAAGLYEWENQEIISQNLVVDQFG